MSARSMEAEAGLFWRLARARAAYRIAGLTTAPALATWAEIEDDLDVMAQHSEWPQLRQAAARLLCPALKAIAL